jgi:hypothetical protein
MFAEEPPLIAYTNPLAAVPPNCDLPVFIDATFDHEFVPGSYSS